MSSVNNGRRVQARVPSFYEGTVGLVESEKGITASWVTKRPPPKGAKLEVVGGETYKIIAADPSSTVEGLVVVKLERLG